MVQSLRYCLKQKVFWIYTILALLAVVKQCWNESVLIDSQEYFKKAQHLFDHWDLENVPQNRILEPIRRTIGYPIFIKLFNHSHLLLIVFQLIVSLFIPLILHRVIQKFNYFSNLWEYSMIALFSYPLQFYYTGFAMPEILVQATLLLWVLFYFEGHWRLLPVFSSILILLKPVFLVFLLFPLVLFFLKRYKPTVLDFLPLVVYLFFSAMNYKHYRVFEYSSVGYTNAYDYNRKKFLIQKFQNDSFVDQLYDREYATDIKENQNNWPKLIGFLKAKTTPILTDPLYWWIHFKGLIATFIDPGRYDAMVFLNWNKSQGFMGVNDGNIKSKRPLFEWIYIIFFLGLSILKLFGAFIAVYHWRRYFVFVFFTFLVILFAFIAGPVGSARYLLPFYPMMAFLSAMGFSTLVKKRDL